MDCLVYSSNLKRISPKTYDQLPTLSDTVQYVGRNTVQRERPEGRDTRSSENKPEQAEPIIGFTMNGIYRLLLPHDVHSFTQNLNRSPYSPACDGSPPPTNSPPLSPILPAYSSRTMFLLPCQ